MKKNKVPDKTPAYIKSHFKIDLCCYPRNVSTTPVIFTYKKYLLETRNLKFFRFSQKSTYLVYLPSDRYI